MLGARYICFLILLTSAAAQPPALTEDPSGLYTFIHDGESVQITVEPTPSPETDWSKPWDLDGYVSRDDDGRIVDLFFKSGSLANGKLKFITKPVHSVWYEFDGRINRGEAKSRDQEGYFVVTGRLVEHSADKKGKPKARTREVEFKSFASLEEAPPEGVPDRPPDR